MTSSIDVQRIVKTFGDFTAVKGITFNVAPGEVIGLLGPNGAGKSTLIRMMTTLLIPTAGTAVINKRAGGTGLISGRKAFQRPLKEGVELLNAVQDVYLDKEITVA